MIGTAIAVTRPPPKKGPKMSCLQSKALEGGGGGVGAGDAHEDDEEVEGPALDAEHHLRVDDVGDASAFAISWRMRPPISAMGNRGTYAKISGGVFSPIMMEA